MFASDDKNNDLKVLEAIEYGAVESASLKELDWKDIPTCEDEERKASQLGLEGNDASIKVGDYVGLVWWPKQEGKLTLRVNPKFENMDYYAMYLECMSNTEVSQHMKNCFYFWPEQSLIEVAKRDVPLLDSLAPFAALAFVRELYDMIRRNMRTNFVRTERNLTGRIKGRILINQQVKRNLLIGRMDRNYCEYSESSNDCRENRILLAALEQSVRVLEKNKLTKTEKLWHHWARTCRSALEGVRLQKIHNRDYANIHYTGTFVHYKRPHALARLILNDKELDPSKRKEDHTDDDMIKVVPFALCTFELFERYTEVKLRDIFKAGLIPDRGGNIIGEIPAKRVRNETDEFVVANYKNDLTLECRPDFLVPCQENGHAYILDSKYKREKYKPKNSDEYKDILHHDFRQIVFYAANLGVLKALNVAEKSFYLHDPKISAGLIYPVVTGEKLDDPIAKYFPELNEIDNENRSLFSFNAYRLECPNIKESIGSDSIDLT